VSRQPFQRSPGRDTRNVGGRARNLERRYIETAANVTSGDGVAVVIAALGDLSFYYRMGETGAFPAGPTLADTSGFDSTPRDAAYFEHSAGPNDPWSTANRPTLGFADPGLGSFDDGAIDFNYDQSLFQPFYSDRAGAGFAASMAKSIGGVAGDLASFGTNTGTFNKNLQTAMCFFKPKRSSGYGGATDWGSVPIIGNLTVATSTQHGWALGYDPFTETLTFINAGVAGGALISTPCPSGAWYHGAVTWDGAVYTLYLNGLPVGTHTSSAAIVGNLNLLYIDYGRMTSGVSEIDAFYFGAIDEIAGFSRCLTAGEIAAVYDTGINAGGSVAGGLVWTSPGDGTAPSWQPPSWTVYHNGV
jgi:hypothetical protein